MWDVLSLISLENTLALPWEIMVPGLLIIALFLARAIRSFFTLRIITAFTSLVYAFLVALILSQFGMAAAQLIGIDTKTPAGQTSIQHLLHDWNESIAELDGVFLIEMNPVQT